MKKAIFVILITFIILIVAFIWLNRAYFVDPSGVYINRENISDTIKLYSNGVFEQRVYNKDKKLVYNGKSKWRTTGSGVAIDSIFLYGNWKQLDLYCKYGGCEGESFDGLQPSYENGEFTKGVEE